MREDTGNAGGYFDMMRDYILDGKLPGKYGDAVLYRTLSARPALR